MAAPQTPEEVKKQIDDLNTAMGKMKDVPKEMVEDLQRLLELYDAIKDEVMLINQFQDKTRILEEKMQKNQGLLKKIYSDKTKELKENYISENNILKTAEKLYKVQLDNTKNMESGLGVTGEMVDLEKQLTLTLEAQLAMYNKHQDALTSMSILFGKNITQINGMTGAVKLVRDSIGAGGLIQTISLLTGAFDKISGILFEQNEQVSEMQKTLMLSGNEAREIRNTFVDIERTSNGIGSTFQTVKNMIEASNQLSEAFGASVDFSQGKSLELVKDQIALTKELGMANAEAARLGTQMQFIGMSEKTMGEMAAKSNIESKMRLGVTFSLKGIMADISKMSAATFLSLSKNPKALADAVVYAKQLGVSLDKMNGIADGLLNIESSLVAQFEASVLTGKNLNFELARELALQNDIAGATKQILSQVGSAGDFTRMNRIQQEAIAKSVGMNRDELAGSLMIQENLNKLGSVARAQMEEKLKGMDTEQQKKFMLGVTDDKAAYTAAKKVAAQEKLNVLQEKFVSMVTNLLTPLEPLVDMFANIAEILSPILGKIIQVAGVVVNGILGPIVKLVDVLTGGTQQFTVWEKIVSSIAVGFGAIFVASKGIALWNAITSGHLVTQVGLLWAAAAAQISAAVAAVTGASAMTLGIAAGIALAAGGAAYYMLSANNKVQDAQIAPDGGLVVSGAKGTYQLDKNDSVIAGTSLGGKVNGGSSNNVDMSGVIKAIQDLQVDVRNMKTALIIDGREFGRLVKEITSQKVARA